MVVELVALRVGLQVAYSEELTAVLLGNWMVVESAVLKAG